MQEKDHTDEGCAPKTKLMPGLGGTGSVRASVSGKMIKYSSILRNGETFVPKALAKPARRAGATVPMQTVQTAMLGQDVAGASVFCLCAFVDFRVQ